MAHGTPDWGHARQITSFSMVDDLAELAARLGSIHVHDRRGDVLWMDKFATSISAWVKYSSGTGGAVAISQTLPKWPPYCMKLTGGSDASQLASITYRMGLPTLKRVGVEASVAFFTRFGYFWTHTGYYSGTQNVYGILNFDDDARKLYYYDSGGDWAELDDIADLVDSQAIYHVVKLVMDYEKAEYLRVIVNNIEYDMSGIAARTTTSAVVPHYAITYSFYSRAGENDYCQVDGVIITQDEP